MDIEVSIEPAPDGWYCAVTLRAGGESRYQVHVSRVDLARLAPGAADPADLVRASFAFLLERESPSSILRRFDLRVIGSYFPDYEATMLARLGR